MLKKIKRNIFLIYYTIRLICKICKAKFILAFILSIINGILPVSSLLVMQQLLNEIQNKTQSYQYVVYLLILYFGLIISESLLQNLASYNLNNLNNHLVYGINYILMKKCGDNYNDYCNIFGLRREKNDRNHYVIFKCCVHDAKCYK